MKIGDDLGTNYYALAFPKGSRYSDIISRQILKYNDDGTLHALKKKWKKLRYSKI